MMLVRCFSREKSITSFSGLRMELFCGSIGLRFILLSVALAEIALHLR